MQAASHKERLEQAKKERPIFAARTDYSMTLAVVYLLMAYGLGLLFSMMPYLYLEKIRGLTEAEKVQARTLSTGYNLMCLEQTNEQTLLRYTVVVVTFRTIGVLSLLSVALFKLL